MTTLCAAFQDTAHRCRDRVALRRSGGAQEITWGDYARRVERIAGGLAGLGVQRGECVAIMLTNRPEFFLVDTAAMHLGAVPFSMYNTSSLEQLQYLLTHSGAKVVITESCFVGSLVASGARIDHVVIVDAEGEDVRSLEHLEDSPFPAFDFEATWRSVRPDDIATLIYTSGTTGSPKGVELSHGAVLEQAKAIDAVIGHDDDASTVSYLPSAHAADRLSSHYLPMLIGAKVTTVSDARALVGALIESRPTIFGAVPRIWEKIRLGVDAAIGAMEPDQRAHVIKALDLGLRAVGQAHAAEMLSLEEQLEYCRLDGSVLAPLRARFGLDRLRSAMSGAAPISPENLRFFAALGISINEVWGMSETSGVTTANPPGAIRIGSVGIPLSGMQVWLSADNELLVRGPTLMRGYRNDPVRTAEAIDADGWLNTGDIATIDSDGYVRIVDRKKELIVNSAGKNMSPANIENCIKAHCPLVAFAVVIGDARQYNTALLALDPDALAAFSGGAGNDGRSFAELTRDDAVRDALAVGIAVANAELSRVEQIKKFGIVDSPWLPGGDEVTPTLKIRRKPIDAKYADLIESLYASTPSGSVIEPRQTVSPGK